MRRILAIVLLALLPLQLSWAAVASYCEHETNSDAGHFGHHQHQHQHHGDAGADADSAADPSAHGDKAPGAVDFDCGHCHGHTGALPTLAAGLPGLPATTPPTATINDAGSTAAPARPERPQWRPFA